MLWCVPSALALTLSYEDALERAGKADLEVRDAQADVRAAEGAVLAARAPFEPTLTAEGAGFSDTDEGTDQLGDYYVRTRGWEAGVTLAQPLATGTSLAVSFDARRASFLGRLLDAGLSFSEDPRVRTSLAFTISQALLEGHRLAYNLQALRAAKGARTVAEATRQARRERVLADTAAAFWEVRYRHEVVAIATQTLDLAREQGRAARVLLDAGKLAPVEGLRAEAAEVDAERALIEARSAAAAADDALLVLVGEAPGTPIVLSSPVPEVTQMTLDPAAVADAVLQGNPELTGLRVDLDLKRQAVDDARHALLPRLDAAATYAVRGYEPDLAGSFAEMAAGDLPAWSVGGTLTLPLYDRADRGALLSAQAASESAEIAVRRLEDTLVVAARAQVRALEDAARDVELARRSVRLAEETLAAETTRLQAGGAPQRDVSDALRSLASARMEAERAATAYAVALVELERLKGTL